MLEGNVTINTAGVTLQNTTITGNLYLTEGIGVGDVTLNNVTVQGTTKISGGGRNSIHLLNTTIGTALVNVPSRKLVRLLAQGSTTVGFLEARTPAILEETEITGSGFSGVIINTQENVTGITVKLLGQFNAVEVQSAATQLDLQEGSIADLTLSTTAQAAQINLAGQTTVDTLIANAPATVQGQGTVETAQANVDGVVIEGLVKIVFVAEGVQANIAGKIITEDYKYTEPKKKKSKAASLSDLMINGTTVAGFAADTLSYDVVLPYRTTEVPTVTAEAQHAKASITITQATGLTSPNNIATVVVTAENGRTQTYTVCFTVTETPIDDFAYGEDDGTSATFTWPTAGGATSIKIEQSVYNSVDETWTEWTTAYTALIEPTATSATVVGLTAGETYKFRLVVTGGNNAGDSNEVDVTTSIDIGAATYGASWDSSTSSTSMTRMGDAVGKTAGADFDGFAPWSDMKLCNVDDDGTITAYIDDGTGDFKWDGSNGQVMVKIPQFYYKHTFEDGVHEFWVADGPAAGFKLHPAFIRAGVEKPYVLLGAYKASFGRNQADTADALASVSGVIPAVSRNIAQFRTLAEARGQGWTLADVLTRNAVALLYLVEYADTNSQAAIGEGITRLRWSTDDKVTVASTNANTITVSSATAGNYSKGQIIGVGTSLGNGSVCTNRMITGIAAPVDGNVTITVDGVAFSTSVKVGEEGEDNYIYHVGQKTGGCDNLPGGTGNAPFYSDGETPGVNGKVSVSYRGLEDLWGNVWEFVDGINIKNSEKQPYIADNGFVSNEFAEPYQPSGITLPLNNGYVKDFACSAKADWLLMPTTVEGDNNFYVPDYYYQDWTSSADKVALVGGRWDHGSSAGLFYWIVNITTSSANLTLGARLLQIPE